MIIDAVWQSYTHELFVSGQNLNDLVYEVFRYNVGSCIAWGVEVNFTTAISLDFGSDGKLYFWIRMKMKSS